MTIKALHDFLSKRHKLMSTLPLRTFANTRVAVDVSVYLYKFYNSSKSTALVGAMLHFDEDIGRWRWDESSIELDVVEKVREQVELFRKNYITPVYVFDGKPTDLKDKTIEERNRLRLEKQAIVDAAARDPNNEQGYKDALLAMSKPPSSYKILLSQFFDSWSVEYYWAEGEADPLLAAMNRSDKVDAVLSLDGDQVAYGTKVWMKKLILKSNEAPRVEVVTNSELLQGLKLTQDQLTALCIASGTDYNDNVFKFGIGNCYKLLIKDSGYKNIRELATHPKLTSLNWQDAYQHFTADVDVPDHPSSVPTDDRFSLRSRWSSYHHPRLEKLLIPPSGPKKSK